MGEPPRPRQSFAFLLHPLIDAALFFAAGLLAMSFDTVDEGGAAAARLRDALTIAIVLLGMNTVCGVYRSHALAHVAAAALRTALVLLAGVPLAMLLLDVVPVAAGTEVQFGYVLLLAWTTLAPVRPLLRPRDGLRGRRRVLFVGAGGTGLLDEHSRERKIDQQFIDNLLHPQAAFDTAAGWRVVPHKAPLSEIVARHRVSEMVVLPRQQRGDVLPMRELLDCRLRGIRVTDLAGFVERECGAIPLEALKASTLIYGDGFHQRRLQRVLKRGFDLALAAPLTAVMALPMLLAALALRLQGNGPVLDRKLRVGRAGARFELLRFRVDCVATDDGEKGDRSGPRAMTAVGRVLRELHMDALPQLLNVLRGEMSLVGPRPEKPGCAAALREHVPFYNLRNGVRPGLIGWARLRAGAFRQDPRSELALDLYYVKNRSLLLDAAILFRLLRGWLYLDIEPTAERGARNPDPTLSPAAPQIDHRPFERSAETVPPINCRHRPLRRRA